MSYEEWEIRVSRHLREDPIWTLRVYRMALDAAFLGRQDAALLAKRRDYAHLADQLLRAIGSISSNIAEGYCRLGRRDRGKFYEYALGSTRESRDWYHQARDALGELETEARLDHLGHVTRILIALVAKARPSAR